MTQIILICPKRARSGLRFRFYARNYARWSRCGSDCCRVALDLKGGASFPESGTSLDDFIMHNISHMLPGGTPDWKAMSTGVWYVSMKRLTARSKLVCITLRDTHMFPRLLVKLAITTLCLTLMFSYQ
jgi:hypothetical protein